MQGECNTFDVVSETCSNLHSHPGYHFDGVIARAGLLMSLLRAIQQIQHEIWIRFEDCGLVAAAYANDGTLMAEMRLKSAAWKYYRTTYNCTTCLPCLVKVNVQTMCDLLSNSNLDVYDSVRLYVRNDSTQLQIVVEGMCAALPRLHDQTRPTTPLPVRTFTTSFKVQSVELQRMLKQVSVLSNSAYVNLREYDDHWYLTMDTLRDGAYSHRLDETGRVTAHTIALALMSDLQPCAMRRIILYLRGERIAAMLENLHM